VTIIQADRIDADLRRYFLKEQWLFQLEFSLVVTDIGVFSSKIVHHGLEAALTSFVTVANEGKDCRFIEAADAIVEHHLRFVRGPEREIIRESVFAAYIYAAGSQYLFEPPKKTRLDRSLRKLGVQNFACMIFSLCAFNAISSEIENDASIGSKLLYKLRLETVCRDVVKAAANTRKNEITQSWAQALARTVEGQLVGVPS